MSMNQSSENNTATLSSSNERCKAKESTESPIFRKQSCAAAAKGGEDGNQRCMKAVLRIRRPSPLEFDASGRECFTQVTHDKCLLTMEGKADPYSFTLDRVFDQHSRQQEVFEEIGLPAVDDALAGFSSSIFAFGQTGAGKTHMLVGQIRSEERRGLAPRMLEYLFERIAEEPSSCQKPTVIYSSMEMNNEFITDLLSPTSTNLPLRNDTKTGAGFYVEGLKEVKIANVKDALDLLELGVRARTKPDAGTASVPDRSIFIVTCTITRKQIADDGAETTSFSRLNLVNLGGSERPRMPEMRNRHEHLKAGSLVSKSLRCFCHVVKELLDAQRKGPINRHIPYRDSKLTALFQDSLGGNTRTTVIACVSPMYCSSGETLSSLQFLQRVRHIKKRAKPKERFSNDDIDPVDKNANSRGNDLRSAAEIKTSREGLQVEKKKLERESSGQDTSTAELQTHFEKLMAVRHSRLWNFGNSAAPESEYSSFPVESANQIDQIERTYRREKDKLNDILREKQAEFRETQARLETEIAALENSLRHEIAEADAQKEERDRRTINLELKSRDV